MEKIAFKMKLKPGMKAEYIKRHAEIWPELKQLLVDTGVSDYSIFLDEETHTLFGVQKTSGAEGSQDLGKLEIVQRWWKHMADIMETNPDHSPVTIPLEQVWHMDLDPPADASVNAVRVKRPVNENGDEKGAI